MYALVVGITIVIWPYPSLEACTEAAKPMSAYRTACVPLPYGERPQIAIGGH